MKLQYLSLILLPLTSLASSSGSEQIIMGDTRNPFVPEIHPKPTLSDLLTIDESVSIFYSYARELELSKMFGEETTEATLFVPTNKAVMALTKKPHQGQGSNVILDDVHITEDEYEKKAKANVKRWVSAHIIPEFPITFDSNEHPTLLDGKFVSFKPISRSDNQKPEWSRFTLEDGVRIVSMKEASNGVLYLIDTAISPE